MAEISKGSPLPLGCSEYGEKINFSIAADADCCELLLYKNSGKIPEYIFSLERKDSVGNLRCLSVTLEDAKSYRYNYRLDGKCVLDPYAKSIEKIGDGLYGTRVCQTEFEWGDDSFPALRLSDTVAYALHVKGFTAHSTSDAKYGGTFKGIIEKIGYMKELGVNQLHLMPVYEFEDESQGKKNYWGYGNGYFFAPKSSYAVSDPVNEMKEMIKVLHKEKMEIILEMPFTEGVPQNVMADALRYWRSEYHVDGFILNPYTTDWRMVTSDPMLSGTKILKKQDEFASTMRRFLKSDAGMIPAVIWQSRQIPRFNDTYNYITDQSGFTLEDLVSYNEKHNEDNGEYNTDGTDYNFSWNCGEEGDSTSKEVIALRNFQKRNALFLLFLSQGVPCLRAGDEFGNTQFGNNNPYCQDNEITWLDWNDLKDHREFFEFVKELIGFRKKYQVFHPDRAFCESRNSSYGIPEISYHGEEAWIVNYDEESRSFSIFYHIKERVEEFCLVVYNMHWETRSLALPSLPKGKMWYEAASTSDGIIKETKAMGMKNKTEIGSRMIKVFVGK